MADFVLRNVEYETDSGVKVIITVKYENFSDPTPQTRFTKGGFGDENKTGSCRIFNRRGLKPRYVIIKFNNKPAKVIVKNKSTYENLLKDRDLIRYCGECSCKL